MSLKNIETICQTFLFIKWPLTLIRTTCPLIWTALFLLILHSDNRMASKCFPPNARRYNRLMRYSAQLLPSHVGLLLLIYIFQLKFLFTLMTGLIFWALYINLSLTRRQKVTGNIIFWTHYCSLRPVWDITLAMSRILRISFHSSCII